MTPPERPTPRTHKEFIAWHLARRREMSLGRLAALHSPFPRLPGHWRTDLEIAADLMALSKLIVVERDAQGKRLVATWRLQEAHSPRTRAACAGSMTALMLTSACSGLPGSAVAPAIRPSADPLPVYQGLRPHPGPYSVFQLCSGDCSAPTPKIVAPPTRLPMYDYYTGLRLNVGASGRSDPGVGPAFRSIQDMVTVAEVRQELQKLWQAALDHPSVENQRALKAAQDWVLSIAMLADRPALPDQDVPAAQAVAHPVPSGQDADASARPDAMADETPQAFVERWARDWSAKDIEATLGHYSDSFAPNGKSLDDWRAWRRLALARPGPLSVQIELRAVRQRGATTDVLFWQTYRSDYFKSRIGKMLRLAQEDGGWKIRREIVVERGAHAIPQRAAQKA